MSPIFTVRYHHQVVADDIPSLGSMDRLAIKKSIDRKLTTNPKYFGVPLKHDLGDFWKLRVGHYRVIFLIDGQEVVVVRIGHRRDVYKRKLPKL